MPTDSTGFQRMSAADQRALIIGSAVRALNVNGARHAYDVLPLRDAIDQYVAYGRTPGDFLRALLSNNLSDAAKHADDLNLWLLPIYAAYLYNRVPGIAWGSSDAVATWLAGHSERRQRERDADAVDAALARAGVVQDTVQDGDTDA